MHFCLLFLLVDADFGGELKREDCACCWVYLLFAVVISTCHHHIFNLCEHVACEQKLAKFSSCLCEISPSSDF